MAERAVLDFGPFRVRAQSGVEPFIDLLGSFYEESMLRGEHVVDYDIRMLPAGGWRRFVRRQILFEIDGKRVFDPHPIENTFPMFEWGLNWCIATSAHRYLMLHAGSVAVGDQALIMPGTPGSGKSTLSAALHLRGARLLSDEFGLVRPERGDMLPMPRGIPLKNTSIEAILEFEPEAPLGPTYPKTRKGRVRHLRPASDSLIRQSEPASPRWLVFPAYHAGASDALRPLNKTDAFRQLAFNCFNYRLMGEDGFRAVAHMIQQMDCYTLAFGDLQRAVARLGDLIGLSDASTGGGQ